MFSYFEDQRHFETFLKLTQLDLRVVRQKETKVCFEAGEFQRQTSLFLASLVLDDAIDDYFRKTQLSDYEDEPRVAARITDLARYRAGVVFEQIMIYDSFLNQSKLSW